jgi:HAD superfamily phosphoserine phosphatase-like hydrolase
MAVVAAFLRHIAGVREKDFVAVAEHIAEVHRDRVYRYTRNLVRLLKRRGYFLLAISHSPKYLVERLAKQWKFDKNYGVLLELDERTGRFTGKRLHEDVIFDKAKVLRRAIEKERLTLRGSVGVGDTESDIPFLKMVERPICFNPNVALYRAAKRYGWPVVVERKDVIYEMQNSKING